MRPCAKLNPANALLHVLLQALESDEGEAVLGDLVERHETAVTSVRQVLGLILRRQAIAWAGWRPGILLTAIAIPLAAVLSQTARTFAGWSAVASWMLVDNTDAALLHNAGFWYGATQSICAVAKFGAELVCCSWACGRWIARLAGKSRLSLGILFLAASFCVSVAGIPLHARAILLHANDAYFPNRPVFKLFFYRVWFPLIIYAATVFAPALLGMMQASVRVPRSKASEIILTCCTALAVAALLDQPWLLTQLRIWRMIPDNFIDLPSLFPFAAGATAAWLLTGVGQKWLAAREND